MADSNVKETTLKCRDDFTDGSYRLLSICFRKGRYARIKCRKLQMPTGSVVEEMIVRYSDGKLERTVQVSSPCGELTKWIDRVHGRRVRWKRTEDNYERI